MTGHMDRHAKCADYRIHTISPPYTVFRGTKGSRVSVRKVPRSDSSPLNVGSWSNSFMPPHDERNCIHDVVLCIHFIIIIRKQITKMTIARQKSMYITEVTI